METILNSYIAHRQAPSACSQLLDMNAAHLNKNSFFREYIESN